MFQQTHHEINTTNCKNWLTKTGNQDGEPRETRQGAQTENQDREQKRGSKTGSDREQNASRASASLTNRAHAGLRLEPPLEPTYNDCVQRRQGTQEVNRERETSTGSENRELRQGTKTGNQDREPKKGAKTGNQDMEPTQGRKQGTKKGNQNEESRKGD